MAPDNYRGFWNDKDDPDAAKKYALEVKNTIDYSTPGRIAAFLFE